MDLAAKAALAADDRVLADSDAVESTRQNLPAAPTVEPSNLPTVPQSTVPSNHDEVVIEETQSQHGIGDAYSVSPTKQGWREKRGGGKPEGQGEEPGSRSFIEPEGGPQID